MGQSRWQQVVAALATGRVKRTGGVCGGDCGNNDSGYVEGAMAAEAVSHPDCSCGVGRWRQTEQ
jgi:hypothetical protein